MQFSYGQLPTVFVFPVVVLVVVGLFVVVVDVAVVDAVVASVVAAVVAAVAGLVFVPLAAFLLLVVVFLGLENFCCASSTISNGIRGSLAALRKWLPVARSIGAAPNATTASTPANARTTEIPRPI